MNYLQNIPSSANDWGVNKLIACRNATIHIKHIFTEVFARKTIDLTSMLSTLGLTLEDYMRIMTNRLRMVYHFPRVIDIDPNELLAVSKRQFFDFKDSHVGFNNLVILDFDGVITDDKFKQLYLRIVKESNTIVVTANPEVTTARFDKLGLPYPNRIIACKGKVKKLKAIIELLKRYDYCFYIDNEIDYLKYAWIFGIITYHWDGKNIKYFTLKTE